MSRHTKVISKRTLFGKISIVIAVVLILVVINEFVQIVPTHATKLQGGLILLPLFLAPIGVALGLISLKRNRDAVAKWGVILNIILFFFPILYMMLGTLIFGV